LAPARAAGNTAVVLLVFLAWFVVKIIRIQGWTVFSLAFIIGTPLIGLGLVAVLLTRYATGLRDFAGLRRELTPPADIPSPPHATIDPTATA
jgi:hypothetical protein